MFDNLTSALQATFKKLRGHGKLSEVNVKDALREIRLALLEADVHYKVAKDFVARVKEKVMGEEVLSSITPGQQFTKRVNDELVALLGAQNQPFMPSGSPAKVILLGLHGAGKTTTAAKLARRWNKAGRRVLLAGCDIRRPAAVDQLKTLGNQIGVDVVEPKPGESVPQIGKRTLEKARHELADVVLFDTGGRFQIDDELVAEVRDLKTAVQPEHIILVLDAAIGQESVNVAETFQQQVGLTGLILTKLDGDARGGAALSVHAVTGCPVLMVGAGEKMEDLEPFHPDRMASRILGMGDVVSMVEKVQTAFDEEQTKQFEENLRKNSFNLEDFLSQLQQIKKLGPLDGFLDMLPGISRIPSDTRKELMSASDREFKKSEAIIQSMTPRERRNPDIMNNSRRKRVAGGSGTHVKDVNELLKKFKQTKKMMKKLRGKKMSRFPF